MDKMRLITFGSMAFLILVLAVGLLLNRDDPQLNGSQIKPAPEAYDFKLTDQNGQSFQLSDHQGKLVVLFFGYTNCPDFCPTTLAQFRVIKNALEEQSEQVQFVFVTVDPEEDSVSRLKEYVDSFDQKFFGLTGTQTELEPVWKEYGVFREKHHSENGTGGLVDHSTRTYLIDPQGKLILTYPFGFDTDLIIQDLQHLISSSNS
jgi:protein SCO1/2